MVEHAFAVSGSRARTRQAILDAAVEVIGTNASASLAEIAERANVGRSTLHRYFPERIDLIRALARHVLVLLDTAIERAEPDAGDPLAALQRVIEEHLALGPILLYVFSEPLLQGDAEFQQWLNTGDDPLERLFARAAGLFDPRLPRAWVGRVFWSLLYAGWGAMREDKLPRHEVIAAIMHTFTHGVLAPAPSIPHPTSVNAGNRSPES